jgi:hypothetical protein
MTKIKDYDLWYEDNYDPYDEKGDKRVKTPKRRNSVKSKEAFSED